MSMSLKSVFSFFPLIYMATDRDGTIDIVILTCGSVSSTTGVGNDCAINIAYNYQIPLCTNTADNGIHSGKRTCRPPQDLCTADPNFRLSFTSGNVCIVAK